MIGRLCGIATLVFTDGIGLIDAGARGGVVERLSWYGIRLDSDRNRNVRNSLSPSDILPGVLALPSREDNEIVRSTATLANGSQGRRLQISHNPIKPSSLGASVIAFHANE